MKNRYEDLKSVKHFSIRATKSYYFNSDDNLEEFKLNDYILNGWVVLKIEPRNDHTEFVYLLGWFNDNRPYHHFDCPQPPLKEDLDLPF